MWSSASLAPRRTTSPTKSPLRTPWCWQNPGSRRLVHGRWRRIPKTIGRRSSVRLMRNQPKYRDKRQLRRRASEEPCFVFHHASVGISGVLKGNRLDHRADILEDAEGKGVLVVDG